MRDAKGRERVDDDDGDGELEKGGSWGGIG